MPMLIHPASSTLIDYLEKFIAGADRTFVSNEMTVSKTGQKITIYLSEISHLDGSPPPGHAARPDVE